MKIIFSALFFCGIAAAAEVSPIPEVKAPEANFVKIETGQAKLNLLLQAWFSADSTATTAKNNFRARRAEIKFSGNLNPDARWFLMVDPAKSLKTGAIASTNDNKVLQDLGLAFAPSSTVELLAGQMKIPTTSESFDSSGDLPLPERSLLGRNLGDKRQLGFQTIYKEGKWKLTGMVSNGGNTNADDTTNEKDGYVRADFTPVPGLATGAWVGATDFKFGENGKWGLNLRWKGEKEMARFEVGNSDETSAGVKTKSKGYVAEVGYYVLPQLQPVLRFESFTPDTSNDKKAKATTLGLGYFLAKNNQKVQAAFSWMNNMKGSNGSYANDLTIGNGRMFVLAFQMAI